MSTDFEGSTKMDKQNNSVTYTSADASVKMDGFGIFLILMVMVSALFSGPISILNFYIQFKTVEQIYLGYQNKS